MNTEFLASLRKCTMQQRRRINKRFYLLPMPKNVYGRLFSTPQSEAKQSRKSMSRRMDTCFDPAALPSSNRYSNRSLFCAYPLLRPSMAVEHIHLRDCA